MKRKEGGQKIWRVSAEMENRSHFLPVSVFVFVLVFFLFMRHCARYLLWPSLAFFPARGSFLDAQRESVCVEERGGEREVDMFYR